MYILCMTLIPNFWLFGLNDKRIKPIEVDGLLGSSRRNPGSVSLVWWKQCCIHWLHAGWTGKGSHQPVIYTVQVVDVHAWQKSNRVPIHKVHHTNDTSGETRNSYGDGSTGNEKQCNIYQIRPSQTNFCYYWQIWQDFSVTSVLAPPSTTTSPWLQH